LNNDQELHQFTSPYIKWFESKKLFKNVASTVEKIIVGEPEGKKQKLVPTNQLAAKTGDSDVMSQHSFESRASRVHDMPKISAFKGT